MAALLVDRRWCPQRAGGAGGGPSRAELFAKVRHVAFPGRRRAKGGDTTWSALRVATRNSRSAGGRRRPFQTRATEPRHAVAGSTGRAGGGDVGTWRTRSGDARVEGWPGRFAHGETDGDALFENGRCGGRARLALAVSDAYQSGCRRPHPRERARTCRRRGRRERHPAKAQVAVRPAGGRGCCGTRRKALRGQRLGGRGGRRRGKEGRGGVAAIAAGAMRRRTSGRKAGALGGDRGGGGRGGGAGDAARDTAAAAGGGRWRRVRGARDRTGYFDQHAAHGGCVDRLKGRREGRGAAAAVSGAGWNSTTAAAVFGSRIVLERLGLSRSPFGNADCWCGSAGVRDGASPGSAGDAGEVGDERRVADPFDRAAASVACHSSVRAGMALSLEEMRQLIEDLAATASPRTCPHGRPTLVHVRQETLDRQFGR